MDGDSKFGWANLIALCLFVAGYFVKWCLDAWEQRRRRLNFYRAIATEIRLNVDALDRAVSSLPPTSTFRAFVGADPENRPHIISTYMCSIYQSNTGELNQLPQIVTRNIIEFYGMLEFLGEYVRSFDRRSF